MPGKSFFIDTTLCTACRGCQLACKQWHGLPAEKTMNVGSYQNPADLSFMTYKLVRFSEVVSEGKIRWLFFPDQCRHCVEPPCEMAADDEKSVFTDGSTGAVIYTKNTKALNTPAVIESCPYNIPRADKDGTLAKCDMCLDRVENGLMPACVKVCPTGAMQFGNREKILAMAEDRLKTVKKTSRRAMLLDADEVRVVFLVTEAPELYHPFAIASRGAFRVTRKMALKRMVRPIKHIFNNLPV